MRFVTPSVHLLGRTEMNYEGARDFLGESFGGPEWLEGRWDETDAPMHETLIELSGRLCYDSYSAEGGNPNVTRIRTDRVAYLQNLIRSGHGSVLEHASFNFGIRNTSVVMCYDSDTEVLTRGGWKPWPEVVGNEEFATLNPKTNQFEYQFADRVFHSSYDGPMYQVKSEQVDLLVTPHHRMWVLPYDTQKNRRGEQEFEVRLAQDIVHKRVRYQKSADWDGYTPDSVTIPGTVRTWSDHRTGEDVSRYYPEVEFPTRAFAKFLGYYISEGCTTGRMIHLTQNPGTVADSMRNTLGKLGLSHGTPPSKPNDIRFSCVQLYDYLQKLGKSHEKYVPEEVFTWDAATINIFLDALIEGDGSVHHKTGHRVYYTSSKRLADDVQTLSILAGGSSNIWVDDRVGQKRSNITGRPFGQTREGYVVSFIRDHKKNPLINSSRTSNIPNRWFDGDGYHDRFVEYSGNIHCVQVPNGLLWVRKNGKPVVSGNTQELIRHRVGTAISQESGRYVRPTELLIVDTPYMQNPANRERMTRKFERQWEDFLEEESLVDWDSIPFKEKKELTSELRGMLPMRRATRLAWSGNIRSLRHIIDLRTSEHAEWEIRFVFGQVFDIMLQESVALFEDLRKDEF